MQCDSGVHVAVELRAESGTPQAQVGKPKGFLFLQRILMRVAVTIVLPLLRNQGQIR